MNMKKTIFVLFLIKFKNILSSKTNLFMLLCIPLLAVGCAWGILTFYMEGGRSIPVGIVDLDKSDFSETVIERFNNNSSVEIIRTDEKSAPKLISNGVLETVIIISPDFSTQIKKGEQTNLFTILSPPSGISSGVVTELFIAQVSRIYFNCVTATDIVKERSSKNTGLTTSEKDILWLEAFSYSDAFWEPQPLMTIEYSILPVSEAPENSVTNIQKPVIAPSSNESEVLTAINTILRNIFILLFIVYILLCLFLCSGSIIDEKENGTIHRLLSLRFSIPTWLTISAAVPFILFGLPALLILLLIFQTNMLFPFAILFFTYSLLATCIAYRTKNYFHYQVKSFILVAFSFVLILLFIITI